VRERSSVGDMPTPVGFVRENGTVWVYYGGQKRRQQDSLLAAGAVHTDVLEGYSGPETVAGFDVSGEGDGLVTLGEGVEVVGGHEYCVTYYSGRRNKGDFGGPVADVRVIPCEGGGWVTKVYIGMR